MPVRNDRLRRHDGAPRVSIIELSLTLSVIAGLLFVSVRVMNMQPASRGQTMAIVVPITPAISPAPAH